MVDNPCRVLTIDDLPDDDLLEIFYCYVGHRNLDSSLLTKRSIRKKAESWQLLVHVCRRWRRLVFGSPRRLNLQLYCYTERRWSDVWPALPLLVYGGLDSRNSDSHISGLEDRISQINLKVYKFQTHWTALQVPFPKLEGLHMSLRGYYSSVPSLPDSFLGGSAPRMRYFYLYAIPFLGLPKLLLSTTHLVNLSLRAIPQSGYISPEAMATSLSMLASLKTLQLEFEFPQSHPDLKSRPPLPPIRSVLPTLTYFRFKGVNKYLEEFVARIDAPQLCQLFTTIFLNLNFNAPELNQFISRTPKLGAYDEAHFIFDSPKALVRLRQSHEPSNHRMVKVEISCSEPYRQFLSMVQTCISSLRLLIPMENLYIDSPPARYLDSELWDGIVNTEWLGLLRLFMAVKNIYLSEPLSPSIALALQELAGGTTEVLLPALKNVFLEEFSPSKPLQKGIARFISARQLTNYPATISVWDGREHTEWWQLDTSSDSAADD